MCSDEHLDFWGEIFTANRLHARGILFETFLEDPRVIARAAIFRPRLAAREGFLPLLPAQRRVIAKPDARPGENICIGCGCTDSHGCLTRDGACHWLRVDTGRGLGVCSECADLVAAYDRARVAAT